MLANIFPLNWSSANRGVENKAVMRFAQSRLVAPVLQITQVQECAFALQERPYKES